MSNITLRYDEIVEQKELTRSDCCGGNQRCEFITERKPPLGCDGGDRIILFMKSGAVLQPTANAIIVGQILTRTLDQGQYVYVVQYDDALLAAGVSPNTLTQCDVLKACCYDCAAEYADQISGRTPPPA